MAERVEFRGGSTCSCVAKSLPLLEQDLQRRGLLKGPLRIFQLGYRGDVDASAGTHNRGGCVDIELLSSAGIDVGRLWGWTFQARHLTGVVEHCHGWPYGCPHLSPAAKAQEQDWDRRDAGLQGAGKVQGRWPVKPWDVALKERQPPVEQEGVPLMANAVPIGIVDYPGDQALSPNGGRVYMNAKKNTSVVAGVSKGIDVTAGITVEGLKVGERVRVWWRVEWKKDGQPDQAKRGKIPVSVLGVAGEPSPSVQVRYADDLPKADAGWTACLRLMYTTNSKTAKITRVGFDGWRLEA